MLCMLLIAAAIVGLIVGSFLNVVIVRYPNMLRDQWRRECQEHLELPIDKPSHTFNLLLPRSHCPHCHTPLKPWHNIPLLSFLFLGGRCAHCKHKISYLYPTVEFISGVLTVLVVWHFLLTWNMLAALVLTWALITLCFIDLKTQLLPDNITLPILWLGLFLSLFNVFTSPFQAITGAIFGYGVLWITATLFKWVRKKEGMGHGDFKMLGMLGAWFGIPMTLNILFVAVILGLLAAVLLIFAKKIRPNNPIPFGPFIALAGWVTMMAGPFFLHWLIPYWG